MPSSLIGSEFLARLIETEALQEGHFQLSSGFHSRRYFQCARFLQHPEQAEWACRLLAERITPDVDVVVGPALGGILVAHELGRALKVRACFTERPQGEMVLRRGFEIRENDRVLIAEDVVTTGKSALETADAVTRLGGKVVGYAALIDRSGNPVSFDAPSFFLTSTEEEIFSPEECPLCNAGIPLVKPGSRKEARVG